MTTTTIPMSHLRAIAHFMAKDGIGHNLDAVCVDILQRETRLIATNGIALGVARHATYGPSETARVVIPAAIVKAMLKASARYEFHELVLRRATGEGTGWVLAAPDGSTTLAFNNTAVAFGGYASQARRAFRGAVDGGGGVACFDPEHLVLFSKAGKSLGLRRMVPIVRHNGAGGALVHFYKTEGFVGVIMPYEHFSTDTPDRGTPTWLGAL